jgi:hypothetical protein
VAAVGAKVSEIVVDPLAETTPLTAPAVRAEDPVEMPDHVSAAVPLFVMVRVDVAVEPTATLPNPRLPERIMIRVALTAAAIGLGAVGLPPPPPPQVVARRSAIPTNADRRLRCVINSLSSGE